jgi:eukaryotic-like serine/threonine-protein kinase
VVGRSVGPYQLVKRLGAGGMGEVYLARDSRLQRQVAIKSLTSAGLTEPEARGRVLREARAAAALNHPNIATIHDVVEADDRAYIVMEFVEGRTLSARLAEGALPVGEAVAIGLQLAEALDAAHARGIVHRDLKPANICQTASGTIKVLDFGLARRAAPSTELAHTTATHDTFHGQTAGTPGYMAPEQVLGQLTDERTDIYSAGVVLYELLTGRRPFDGPDTLAIAVATVSADPPPLLTVNPGVPVAIAEVVARAMARDPAARYPSARALVEALTDAVAGATTAPVAPRVGHAAASEGPLSATASRPRTRQRLLAAGIALGIVAIAAAVLATRWPRAAPETPDGVPVVAVLPFLSDGDAPANEALAAGFSDVLVATLSKLPEVGVISSAATRDFRDPGRDLAHIAQSLGASFVVDASLQRVADRIRVTVTLVGAGSNLVAWSDHVDGTIDEVFDVQRRLATGLAEGLRLRLSPASLTELSATPTSSREAFTDYARGRALLERPDVPGHVDGAIDAFRAAASRDPEFALAHAGLAEAYWARYEDTRDTAWAPLAVAAAERAAVLDPSSPRVIVSMGRIYAGTGRTDDAVAAFQRAMALQPHDDEVHRLLGRVFERAGRAKEAQAAYERALAIRPGSWHNHSELGAFHFGAGRYADAAVSFRRVTELAPDNAWGFVNLGAAYHAQGDRTRALEYYQRAVAISKIETAYSNIGALLYHEGRFGEAREAFEQAIALAPRRPTYHRNLGDVLMRLGRSTEARASFERAAELATDLLKVNPGDARQLAFLAVVEAKLGRYDGALASAQRAVQLAPEAGDVRYRLGVVQALSGAHDRALATLTEAISLGYSVTLLRADDDLAPLRGHPAYERLSSVSVPTKEDP